MDNQEMNLKISASPHVRSKASTADIMFDVIIALVPATAVGVYNFGLHALLLVITCIASSVLAEFLYEYFMKRPITIGDFSAVVTGLLLAMNLPPTLPLWMAVLGSVFAIIVVKQLFGGLGKNFMNPALAARCFLILSFGAAMTKFTYDGVTTATPLAVIKNGGTYSLRQMFMGFTAGTIGETSALALLIGAAYLLIKKVISPRIPLVYIGTFAVAIVIYAIVKDKDVVNYTLCELCGGGLMLGAWFMATDYVTSPITPVGKIIYGVILGLLTFVLRIFGNGAEGVSYAIIMTNLMVPLIELLSKPKPFGYKADVDEEAEKAKKKDKKSDKSNEKDAEKAVSDDKSDKVSENEKKAEDINEDKKDIRGIFKAVTVIMLITVIMGAILGTVYSITKEPIEQAEEKAKQEAYKEVFPEAEVITTYGAEELDYDAINSLLNEFGYINDTIEEISTAEKESGEFLGYIIVVSNNNGYNGEIKMVVGVTYDVTVTGLAFLTLDESPGLGMEADKDKFKSQFVGKKVEGFIYTKTGATADNEIDALSGATITTSAVVDGVNSAVALVLYLGR
ncbi:MAG: RnfABCDGE type electron transport complex subunit D [Lachnospiraceae bacterium]|nr:RnfABCDGE type electron transport complex subunit D [Lachnospiraceae bacterium]